MALFYVTVKDNSLKRFIVDAETEEEAYEVVESAESEDELTLDRYLDCSSWEIIEVREVQPGA